MWRDNTVRSPHATRQRLSSMSPNGCFGSLAPKATWTWSATRSVSEALDLLDGVIGRALDQPVGAISAIDSLPSARGQHVSQRTTTNFWGSSSQFPPEVDDYSSTPAGSSVHDFLFCACPTAASTASLLTRLGGASRMDPQRAPLGNRRHNHRLQIAVGLPLRIFAKLANVLHESHWPSAAPISHATPRAEFRMPLATPPRIARTRLAASPLGLGARPRLRPSGCRVREPRPCRRRQPCAPRLQTWSGGS